jgi:acyl-coenzyme A synthetase/AMP-(fatty) acid ligase
LFRLVADYRPTAFAGVTQLLTGGDIVPPEQVRTVLRACPGLRITNGYGPTENTTFTTVHHVDDPAEVDNPLPIGAPIQGTRVAVLDHTGRLVPRGGIGELYVSGDGLALGYVGMPKETSAVFGPFSPEISGRLYRTGDLVRWDSQRRMCFLGRRDHQVKIRGFRIEMDGVARTLREHDAVTDAVVVTMTSGPGERRLLAGLVIAEPNRSTVEDVRAFAARRLPAHAVPALWAVVDSLPVTRNGKIDVARLTQLAEAPAEDIQAELDAVEQAIAATWSKVLGTSRFGSADRFFDAGGDSLQVLRVAAGLRRLLCDYEINVQDLFAHPTISGLADHLRTRPRNRR